MFGFNPNKINSHFEQKNISNPIEKHLIKVYRSGPMKNSMFYVSPDREYVEKSYEKMNGGQEIQEFEIDPGRILDLTDTNYQKSTIIEVLQVLKQKGVSFTSAEENSLKSFFKLRKSTFFNTKYQQRPLWQFINFKDEIANATKRSGFDSIKQYETSNINGADWDWSKKALSYFILKDMET